MNLIFNSIIGMFCAPQKNEDNHIVYSASKFPGHIMLKSKAYPRMANQEY